MAPVPIIPYLILSISSITIAKVQNFEEISKRYEKKVSHCLRRHRAGNDIMHGIHVKVKEEGIPLLFYIAVVLTTEKTPRASQPAEYVNLYLTTYIYQLNKNPENTG